MTPYILYFSVGILVGIVITGLDACAEEIQEHDWSDWAIHGIRALLIALIWPFFLLVIGMGGLAMGFGTLVRLTSRWQRNR